MPQARVTAEHRAPQRPAIQVRTGERVRLGDHDSQWPQFVWTIRADGLGGWIPRALFAVDADGVNPTAQTDYDTRELDADAGELLTVDRELANWWWAENRHGAQGWVPARNIELIQGAVA